jgi:chaperonin GroEL
MATDSYKEIIFDSKAREQLLEGVDVLANAVKITMGPRGQNVVIERPGQVPHLTKDGVTVARAINLRDRFLNLGVQMVKEAASRTAEVAGDGTTAATVLSQAIFNDGLKMLAAGYSSIEICKGINIATDEVVEYLKQIAIPVTSDDEIIQVGTISANGDKTIGELLCRAMSEVGRDGIIAVEEAKGFKTTLDIVDGTEINRGYLSPYFITNQDKMAAVMDNPYILLMNRKITSLNDILPLLEKVHGSQRSILIVADDVDGDALHGLVLNSVKGTLNVCAIRAPEFGESRVGALGDLATILGGKVLGVASSDDIKDTELEQLGTARKVIVGKNYTTFIDCAGSSEDIEKCADELRACLNDPTLLGPDRDVISRRLARLAGGVAILRVGGATEVELMERKDRVDDALHATQAAVEEGLLFGGGVALVRAARHLEGLKIHKKEVGIQIGIDVVRRACAVPFMQIVQNSGGSPEIILEKVSRSKDPRKGYDAAAGEYVDMMDAGIIDPLKVVRSSLEHAASAACNLLSVGCAMIEDDKDEECELGSSLVTS